MADGELGQALRERAVFVRGRGNDEHARERQVGGDPGERLGRRLRQIRQTPPPYSAAARLSAWPSSGSPSSSSSAGSASSPAAAAPATSPSRDRGGARAEPALERDPVDEREAVALDGRDERERAQREMRRVARELAGALALDLDRGSSASSICSSFQRSSAAAAQSKPGPRFAVDAGGEGPRSPDRLEHRFERRLDRLEPSPSSTASRVLQPVAGEDADDGRAGSSRHVRERGEPGRRGRLAEEPSSRASASHIRVIVLVGDRDDLDAARGDELGHVRGCAGSAIRIAEANVVARSAAWPTTIRVDAPSSAKPLA